LDQAEHAADAGGRACLQIDRHRQVELRVVEGVPTIHAIDVAVNEAVRLQGEGIRAVAAGQVLDAAEAGVEDVADETGVGEGVWGIRAAVDEEVIAGVVADDGVAGASAIIAAIDQAGEQAEAGELEGIVGSASRQVLDIDKSADQDGAD